MKHCLFDSLQTVKPCSFPCGVFCVLMCIQILAVSDWCSVPPAALKKKPALQLRLEQQTNCQAKAGGSSSRKCLEMCRLWHGSSPCQESTQWERFKNLQSMIVTWTLANREVCCLSHEAFLWFLLLQMPQVRDLIKQAASNSCGKFFNIDFLEHVDVEKPAFQIRSK